jgi:hypothetical protein
VDASLRGPAFRHVWRCLCPARPAAPLGGTGGEAAQTVWRVVVACRARTGMSGGMRLCHRCARSRDSARQAGSERQVRLPQVVVGWSSLDACRVWFAGCLENSERFGCALGRAERRPGFVAPSNRDIDRGCGHASLTRTGPRSPADGRPPVLARRGATRASSAAGRPPSADDRPFGSRCAIKPLAERAPRALRSVLTAGASPDCLTFGCGSRGTAPRRATL